MEERITKLIGQRKKININDDMAIQKCWEDMTKDIDLAEDYIM